MGEHGEQRRVRLRQDDLNGPWARRPELLHDAGSPPEQRRPGPARALGLGLQLALEACGDLCRGERRPVVEFDTFAQGERPHESIPGRGPADGQRRIDLGAPLAPDHQRVEDLAGDERDGSLERGAGIEDGRNARRADAHFTADSGVRRDALRRRGHGRAYDQERHHDDQERHKDRHERSQNGSDAIQRRHSHRSLYTWNPLFMPLVSRAEQNIERVRKLLTI